METITRKQMEAYLRFASGFKGDGSIKHRRKRNVGTDETVFNDSPTTSETSAGISAPAMVRLQSAD